MKFNNHSELKGCHAVLSASQYHWLNYDDEKLLRYFKNLRAKEMGTRLHAFAEEAINLKQKLPKTQKTLNMYVNDAINYRMQTEQVLYYSPYVFGTADTISFRKNILRIHDYKSGETPASFSQLMIYAALFCLEYDYKPGDIEIELRIYQNDQAMILHPEIPDIVMIMDKIKRFDKLLSSIESED